MAQVVEGISNVLQPKENDTEYILFQMDNTTSQSTQILSQLVHKMKQIQTLMAHINTKLNSNNKKGGNYNNTGDDKKK